MPLFVLIHFSQSPDSLLISVYLSSSSTPFTFKHWVCLFLSFTSIVPNLNTLISAIAYPSSSFLTPFIIKYWVSLFLSFSSIFLNPHHTSHLCHCLSMWPIIYLLIILISIISLIFPLLYHTKCLSKHFIYLSLITYGNAFISFTSSLTFHSLLYLIYSFPQFFWGS